MGQRIQLIVRLPKIYYNEGNPNNKPERIKVFHNQYGDLIRAKNVLEFFKNYDNNNGYMYLVINKDGKMKYCILNGNEDVDEIKIRTPKEYINLFYTYDEIKDEKELQEAIKFLNECPKIDVFKDLKQFKKKIEKIIINEVAETL